MHFKNVMNEIIEKLNKEIKKDNIRITDYKKTDGSIFVYFNYNSKRDYFIHMSFYPTKRYFILENKRIYINNEDKFKKELTKLIYIRIYFELAKEKVIDKFDYLSRIIEFLLKNEYKLDCIVFNQNRLSECITFNINGCVNVIIYLKDDNIEITKCDIEYYLCNIKDIEKIIKIYKEIKENYYLKYLH